MNKKGLGEPLAIIVAFILILLVLGAGFTLLDFFGKKTTTSLLSGGYSSWLIADYNQDMLISILSLETEYGDLSNLIASKDEEKIKSKLEEIEKNFKEKTEVEADIEIFYPKDEKEPVRNKFRSVLGAVSFPDINGDKVIVVMHRKDE